MTDAPSPSSSFWFFAGLTPGCPCLFCTREPGTSQTWTQNPGILHQHWVEGKDHLLQPAVNTLPSAHHDTIGLLCFKGTVLAHGQLGVYLDPWGFFCHAALQLVSPQHGMVHRVIPRPRAWHFPFLNFMTFLPAHFSSLLKSLYTAQLWCAHLRACTLASWK